MKTTDLFRFETDYADLPADGAVEHLRQAIRFETTGYVDTSRVRYDQFDAFHAYIRESYPALMAAASYEEIGHSVLITIPGSDPSLRPALFMAHQDVVPVVPGTEKDWLHGPFSGDLADGYIWGRGTLDIKEMVIAILESADYLLAHGERFRRTTYLAFGEDEETVSGGAKAIARTLQERGVTLEFVLDEGGGAVIDAADWCAPGALLCPICTYEKGYADMRLFVRSTGGHSSNPFHGTSLGTIARGITAIVDNPPAPCLSDSARRSLQLLAPRITEEPLASWVQDIDAHEEEILGWFMSHESLYHLVSTTVAPTMISGGSQAGNVLPQNMEAVVNFRLCPHDTPESLMAAYRSLVDEEVELSYGMAEAASVPSDVDSYGYRSLQKVLERYFDGLIFIPVQSRGATDARRYEDICRSVLRFGPFLEEGEIASTGVHGTNERISVRVYLQGIRALIRMMQVTCVQAEDN